MSRAVARTLCILCGWALAGLGLATAAQASVQVTRTVRLGAVPPLPSGSRVLGPLNTTSALHIAIALAPRDPAALQQFATEVSTPGSPLYHSYITPAQFASRFGPTEAQIRKVEDSLRAHGLNPGVVTANHLSIELTATAGTLERGLSTTLDRLALPGGLTAVVNRLAPRLDASIAPLVQSVVGLDGTATPRPLLVRPTAKRRTNATPHVVTGGPQPCAAATGAAPQQSAYTADQLASAYTFSSLYRAGYEGQGETVAMYELEPDDPADIAAFQACYGTHTQVSYTGVDGGAGVGPGSGEAALDIETLIGLAPQANILVYQAPNSDSSAPGSGPFDDFAAIVAQDRAQIVSVSWGECEELVGAANLRAENTLFEEAAAQGQTIVSASGDSGSEGCYAGGLTQALNSPLTVDDPSSQPFVTGVGGATTSAIGPRPTQYVWNGGGNALAAAEGAGAGGGGISALWPMPAYQSGAAPGLGVLRGASSTPCGNPALCREGPDVSADADPDTGYLIYWNGSGTADGGGQPSGWLGIGGTSLAAPIWASMFALTDSLPQCQGSRIGFANPGLYRAAGTGYSNDFNDVASGNNDLTGTHGSQFAATAGYDMASGLGSPNAAALAPALCTGILRLTTPATQESTVRQSVTLRLRTTGGDAGLFFAASGLPAGLSINSSTGVISGTPHKIAPSTVVVAVRDSTGESASTFFHWQIFGAPSASRGSIKHGALTLTVSAGRSAPAITKITVGFPRSFHERSKTVRLRSPSTRVKLTARVPKRIRAKQVKLTLTLTNTLGNVTRLSVTARVG
ncbi:MAG TPA: protease pro-enzyme activation domain-containing protein [Solirubrobacteraceae bacterium]|jgi:subtilase family serine protease|nr:protease pro-enzyme activation domain-containing protein [Solirubrobacteraceae bacterium]